MTFDFSQITEVQLSSGAHDSPEDGLCAMELVAWFNGEPHSDQPHCTCPLLAGFVIVINDNTKTDVERDRLLKPILPRLVGTRSSDHRKARFDVLARGAKGHWLDDAKRFVVERDHFHNAGLALGQSYRIRGLGWQLDAVAALKEAIKAGPQGDFAHDPVERYEALKQLVSA